MDGAIHVNLSQESSELFSADHNFLTQLQHLQQHQVNTNDHLIKPKQEEIIATVRQAMKIAEDDPSVMEYCETRMNQLLADVTSMVGGKQKQDESSSGISHA